MYGFYKTTTKQQQKIWLWVVTRVSLKPKQDIKMAVVRPMQVQPSQNLKHLRLSACNLDVNKKIKEYFVLKYTCFISSNFIFSIIFLASQDFNNL